MIRWNNKTLSREASSIKPTSKIKRYSQAKPLPARLLPRRYSIKVRKNIFKKTLRLL
jgi:hypothetical protein